MRTPCGTNRTNEEEWGAEDFISHRKLDRECGITEEGEISSPLPRFQPVQAHRRVDDVSPARFTDDGTESRSESPTRGTGSGSESPTHFGSASEPECSPEDAQIEVINRRDPLEQLSLSSDQTNQAQMQDKLKQLITEAADGSRQGTEHLQKSLEDWMVRWERAQQEHVIAADQQIRNLQDEVEQLRALKASVSAKEHVIADDQQIRSNLQDEVEQLRALRASVSAKDQAAAP